MLPLDAPGLDPDEQTARRWLQEELSKPEYREHTSLLQRLLDWLEGHLSFSAGGVQVPWYVLLLPVVAVVVGVLVWSLRRFRRTRRPVETPSTSSAAVFGTGPRDEADAYRRRAEQLLPTDPSQALVAAYRAGVARAAERGLLPLTPATTVGDVEVELGQALPQHVGAIRSAGATFAAVRYGAARVGPDDVHAVLRLDDEIAAVVAQGRRA